MAHAYKVPITQSLSIPTYYFPQFTGWHGGLGAHVLGRQQWTGFEGRPQSYTMEVDGYVRPIHSGVGIIYLRDAVGQASSNDLALNVSPKIRVGKSLILTPAASLRFYQSKFLYGSTMVNNSISAGAGFGAFYNETFAAFHWDFYRLHTIIPEFGHFFSIITGRNFTLGSHLLITPTITYHTWESPGTIELNASAQYRWFYLGATYRWNASWGFAAGYEWKERLRVGYSYDFVPTLLEYGINTNHEITLRLLLFRDKGTKRFLKNLPLI